MFWIIAITVLLAVLVLFLLKNFKTPDKAVERKVEHHFPVSDPQFRREMSVLMGASIVHSNHITALQNGQGIFPALLSAVRSANTSITFETHIYWSGEIGDEFSRALAERSRAGVAVSVLVDWVGSSKMEQSLFDSMREAGIQLHRYRPLRWYHFGRMNNRTHRKLMVVDGCIGFIGGVGIADQWTGDAQDAEHWRDIHFLVKGPVVAQLQAAFNDNWIKTTGHVLNGPRYFPALKDEGKTDSHVFIASPAGGSDSMHLMYLLAIAAAEKSIDLAASYFVPDRLLLKALMAALSRGIRVRILLPGPHIDSITVKIASKADWGELLHAGAEIHVYQPTMMHTKLLIIDAEFVSVGSTNFDMRSIQLNDEASLNLYSRDFAAQMSAVFESDLDSATLYSYENWKSRSLREKFYERVLLPVRSQL